MKTKTVEKQASYGFTEKVGTVRKIIAVLYDGKTCVLRGQRTTGGESLSDDEKKLLKEFKKKDFKPTDEQRSQQEKIEAKQKRIQEAQKKIKADEKNQMVFDSHELTLLKAAFERFDIPGSGAIRTFLGIPEDHKSSINLEGDPLTVGIALMTHLSGESEHYAIEGNIRNTVSKFQSLCKENLEASPLHTIERSLAFIVKHADHNAIQPIHDLALFQTPERDWTPSLWYDAVMKEKKLLKYLPRADVVKKYLKGDEYFKLKKEEEDLIREKNNLGGALSAVSKKEDKNKEADIKKKIEDLDVKIKKISAKCAKHKISDENVKSILAKHDYQNAETIDSLDLSDDKQQQLKKYTLLALEHGIDSESYDRGFEILADPKLKTKDRIPDVTIDGANLEEEFAGYYMIKLQPGDYRGPLLGKLTNCCQSIGDNGSVCVEDGMTNPNSGFVAIFKKSKAGVMDPTNDRMIAQSYAWFGKTEETKNQLVLDSWERLGEDNNKLLFPFLTAFTEQVINKGDATKVTLGSGGGGRGLAVSFLDENPTPGSIYQDSMQQWMLGNKDFPKLPHYFGIPFSEINNKTAAFDEFFKLVSKLDSHSSLAQSMLKAHARLLYELAIGGHANELSNFLEKSYFKQLLITGRYGLSQALFIACEKGDLNVVERLLGLEDIKYISATDEYGLGHALIIALEKNQIEIANKLLLAYGDMIDVNGGTYGLAHALIVALEKNQIEIASKLLLAYGDMIDVNGEVYGLGNIINVALHNKSPILDDILKLKNCSSIPIAGKYGMVELLHTSMRCGDKSLHVILEFLKAHNISIPMKGDYSIATIMKKSLREYDISPEIFKSFLELDITKYIPVEVVKEIFVSLRDNSRINHAVLEVFLDSEHAAKINLEDSNILQVLTNMVEGSKNNEIEIILKSKVFEQFPIKSLRILYQKAISGYEYERNNEVLKIILELKQFRTCAPEILQEFFEDAVRKGSNESIMMILKSRETSNLSINTELMKEYLSNYTNSFSTLSNKASCKEAFAALLELGKFTDENFETLSNHIIAAQSVKAEFFNIFNAEYFERIPVKDLMITHIRMMPNGYDKTENVKSMIMKAISSKKELSIDVLLDMVKPFDKDDMKGPAYCYDEESQEIVIVNKQNKVSKRLKIIDVIPDDEMRIAFEKGIKTQTLPSHNLDTPDVQRAINVEHKGKGNVPNSGNSPIF